LIILGDLTDAKDNHGAELVNRVVKEIRDLAALGIRIIILAGNHDWLRQGHEFFKFLSVIPGVEYVAKPTEDAELTGSSAYFLPYSKNPARDWEGMDFSHYQYLFMHQTVKGAVSSNGQEMDGEPLPPLNAVKVYSGDIHVPQVVRTGLGEVEYVGSPYHVHMGDAFRPRCVLLERNGNPVDLHFETISRVTVKVTSLDELRKLKVRAGDQVKLRVELSPADRHEWAAVRREAQSLLKAKGVEVNGVELVAPKSRRRIPLLDGIPARRESPEDSVVRFVEREELGGATLDVGLELLAAA